MPRGIVTLSLDEILVYHRLPFVFCQVALTIGQYHFHSLEGEVLGESSVLPEKMIHQLKLGLHFGPIDAESK